MNVLFRLLGKNTSPTRIAGFVLSNFIGIAIIVGGLFFYEDAKSLWSSDDSFIKNDYLVINKKVVSSDLLGGGNRGFSPEEINDLKSRDWVRDVGEFSSNSYRVWASVDQGGRGMSTMLFFESVPDKFVDGGGSDWAFYVGDTTVPIILSKDYLALYNFGFAGSAGLPKISENVMEGIPLSLVLSAEDGSKTGRFDARIVGFSNRLNTILVPESFMKWSNSEFGRGAKGLPSRLIIDVSSPGDIAIKEYLDNNDLEVAGDKTASSASFLLKVVTGIVLTVGGVITLMSFFVLLLSISLLMEKNRDKIHSLLMLGYPVKNISVPYIIIVALSSALSFGLAVICGYLMRWSYLPSLRGLGVERSGEWIGLLVGGLLTILIIIINMVAIIRRVKHSWRLT